jgi:hypothetical protein
MNFCDGILLIVILALCTPWKQEEYDSLSQLLDKPFSFSVKNDKKEGSLQCHVDLYECVYWEYVLCSPYGSFSEILVLHPYMNLQGLSLAGRQSY